MRRPGCSSLIAALSFAGCSVGTDVQLEGQIVDELGKAIEGAEVSILDAETLDAQVSVHTDAVGAFLLDAPRGGEQLLSAAIPELGLRETLRLKLRDGDNTLDALRLPVGQGQLSGVLTTVGDEPVAGAVISLMQREAPGALPAHASYLVTTDEGGVFEQRWMHEGRYRGVVESTEQCGRVFEVDVTPEGIAMPSLQPWAELRGAVRIDGEPVPQFRVVAHAEAPGQGLTSYRVVDHADGAFRVELSPGSWSLAVVAPTGEVATHRQIAVHCDAVAEAPVSELRAGDPVRGRVIDATTLQPLEHARLTQTFGSAGLGPFSDGDYGGARSDDAGGFTLRTVPGQPFRVVVSRADYRTRVISGAPDPELEIRLCKSEDASCRP